MDFISWLATTKKVLPSPQRPKWLLQECKKVQFLVSFVVYSCILYIICEIYWLRVNYSYDFVLIVILCSKCIALHFTMDIYKLYKFENERNLEMLIFVQWFLQLFIKHSMKMELNGLMGDYVRKLYECQWITSIPFATS